MVFDFSGKCGFTIFAENIIAILAEFSFNVYNHLLFYISDLDIRAALLVILKRSLSPNL